MAHHCEAKLFAHNSYLYDFAKSEEQDPTDDKPITKLDVISKATSTSP
jgi:hypothetical protein